MIFPLQLSRVCLVHRCVDFRKGHEGLLAEAYKLGLSPYKGDLVVFVGRRKNRLKILAADTTGVWVLSKMFHNGIIPREFSFINDPEVSVIAPSAVQLLVEGTKFKALLP
jgi:hypothetical protein